MLAAPAVVALARVMLAAQLSVVVHAPRVTSVCEPVELRVTVTAPGADEPRIGLPSFAPFVLQRATTTPTTGLDARGHLVTVVDASYLLTTDRSGTFTIGSFEVYAAGRSARSHPVTITVRPRPQDVPAIVSEARIDTSQAVNFRAIAVPETVYVGQQATYQVAVFLSDEVRDRLRRSPTFFPPDMQSMLAYDLPAWKGPAPRRLVGRQCYDALLYERAVFPLLPGRFTIPPSQLSYSLALSPGFFSREETRELRTDSALLVAIAPPEAGRPADFSGAVGSFHLFARLDSAQARVGNPLVLTVRVEGEGNIKLLPRPELAVPWASIVAGDERVELDTDSFRVRGAKEFDWMLTPRVAGELDVPPVKYNYFEPETRRYLVAEAPAIGVHVAPGSIVAARDTAPAVPPLSIRGSDRGPTRAPLYRSPVFWAVIALAPIPALVRRRRERTVFRRRDISAAARLRFILRQRGPTDARLLRRAYVEALAERLALAAEPFTREGALERALRHAGVSSTVAAEAEALLRRLDASAYGHAAPPSGVVTERLREVVRLVNDEALPTSELSPRALASNGAMFALVLLAASLSIAAPVHGVRAQSPASDAASLFERGSAAYARHDYPRATDAFLQAARAERSSADAWANYGTAAWASGDTAAAVVGWGRALRLDPGASEVRARLDAVTDVGLGDPGYVPPVSEGPLAIAAALLWVAAWLLALSRRRRSFAVGLGVAAGVLALVAVDARRRLDARDLAVTGRGAILRHAPADPEGRQVGVGEIARMGAREGAWTRVRLSGGRDGWIATDELRPLAH